MTPTDQAGFNERRQMVDINNGKVW